MAVFREQRAITTTNPSGGPGSNLISEQYLGGQYFDRLRANLTISRLGARVISGLQGSPVVIPGLKDSAASGFFAENTAIPSSQAAFRQISMAQKFSGMLTEISYAMLLQGSPDVEALVRDDFAKVMAETIDRVAIQGGGTNEPTGILANTSIIQTTYDPAAPWASVQDFVGGMEDKDIAPESCAFLTNPGVVTYFRQAERTPETFIMEDRNTLDGYTVARTTLCPAETLIFGDFSDLIIGYWDSFNILTNPYASGSYEKGNILVRATLAMDLAVRHIESFGVLIDVKAA
jgi:HK97 family phage major capsid protein